MAAPAHPLFTRTIGPGARLAMWTALSIMLVVLDARYDALSALRGGLATLLRPVQSGVRVPYELTTEVLGFLVRHRELQTENSALQRQHLADMAQLHQLADLEGENQALRKLLEVRGREKRKAVAAEIWTVSRDPFSRHAILDKGASAGIEAGEPVVDAQGLVGQIKHAYPYSSDLLMVTDPDQVVPVYVQRTKQRALVYGTGYGLEVRYQPTSVDIKVGDDLVTSGIDRVYPEGLPLARVVSVIKPTSSPYAKIYCAPLANVNGSKMLMVLTALAASGNKR